MKNNKRRLELTAKEIRLLYYNNYLFERGVISKREHERMNLAIISACGKNRKSELGENLLEEQFFQARNNIIINNEMSG